MNIKKILPFLSVFLIALSLNIISFFKGDITFNNFKLFKAKAPPVISYQNIDVFLKSNNICNIYIDAKGNIVKPTELPIKIKSIFLQDGRKLVKINEFNDKDLTIIRKSYMEGIFLKKEIFTAQGHCQVNTFYENGKLASKINLQNGKLLGTSWLYNKKGRVILQINPSNTDLLNFTLFYSSRKPAVTWSQVNNILNGPTQFFYPQGDLLCKELIDNNTLIKRTILKNNGNIIDNALDISISLKKKARYELSSLAKSKTYLKLFNYDGSLLFQDTYIKNKIVLREAFTDDGEHVFRQPYN